MDMANRCCWLLPGASFLQGALCDQLMRMVALACSPEAF